MDDPKCDVTSTPVTTSDDRPIYTDPVIGDYVRDGWGQKQPVGDDK